MRTDYHENVEHKIHRITRTNRWNARHYVEA
jgi:hypothetical protein